MHECSVSMFTFVGVLLFGMGGGGECLAKKKRRAWVHEISMVHYFIMRVSFGGCFHLCVCVCVCCVLLLFFVFFGGWGLGGGGSVKRAGG